jgi:hypothetical protein
MLLDDYDLNIVKERSAELYRAAERERQAYAARASVARERWPIDLLRRLVARLLVARPVARGAEAAA